MRKRILVSRRWLFVGVGGDIAPFHLEVGPVIFMIKHRSIR